MLPDIEHVSTAFWSAVGLCRVRKLDLKQAIDFEFFNTSRIPSVRELILYNKENALHKAKDLILPQL
jgi:hypothetical protein